MKKVMVIFGTRPEAVKLAPVIRQLMIQNSRFKTLVCVTGQHREMLDQVLSLFQIVPDYDLNIMSRNQDLFDVTVKVLNGLRTILEKERPDLVLVQGDTTTTFVASLAAYYLRIPIGHVEAGLRTHNKYHPFPEEKNRHMTTVFADYHFAPTEWARDNLLAEGIPQDRIWVTGNTGIDALLSVVRSQQRAIRKRELEGYFWNNWKLKTDNGKIVLVTGHRRESFGKGFKNICLALREIAQTNLDVIMVYPIHLNPNVRRPVFKILGPLQANRGNETNWIDKGNIYLIDPLDYDSFVYLMSRSYLILTDSGGIQEEALSLGKPVLVMRNTTERPEGIQSGGSKLVGTDADRIICETQRLLNKKTAYHEMCSKKNPYGDGKAASRIMRIVRDHL